MKPIFVISFLFLNFYSAVTNAVAAPAVGPNWICFASESKLYDAEVEINFVKFNNFVLEERPSTGWEARVYPDLSLGASFSYSITNLGPKPVASAVQLAGFDKDDKLTFAFNASPTLFMVPPGASAVATAHAFLEKSWIAQTDQFCILVFSVAAAS
jgi:hypothetical protein